MVRLPISNAGIPQNVMVVGKRTLKQPLPDAISKSGRCG